MIKISTISATNLRAAIFNAIRLILRRDKAIAITTKREIVAYMVHPETFNRAIAEVTYTCPFCGEPVEIKRTDFQERMSLKAQMKKSMCESCGKDIYLIRDIRPHVFVSGDLPKGFEK